jgi:hypothetical protein
MVPEPRLRERRRAVSTPDDRADKSLPVTAEVGNEGGSYADPTMQRATFDERLPRSERALPGDRASAHGMGDSPIGPSGGADASAHDSGLLRYPTEPPPGEESLHGGLRFDWRAGLIGAAAGLAGAGLALAIQRRRRDPSAD